MYFINIGDEELQHFHKSIGADFSMSLTDILDSNLFNVEEIIANSLYRVYPLFYCKEVISSNSNDKILDTRCLILEKTSNETYLSFVTDETQSNVILDDSLLDIYASGDSLTTDEFNALVYRLREHGVISGSINFEDETSITGTYGTYTFNNISGQLHNDSGLIVNNQIKSNPITVTLSNPFFLNAKYTLTFTVRSLTGANVCEDYDTDYITVDTFNVVLVEDSAVSVNLSDYVNDSVLDYDVTVSVSFDVPEIVNAFTLALESSVDFIPVNQELSLTATLTSEDNVQGYIVSFYEDNVLIDTATTDSNGEASIEYTPTVEDVHAYSCSVLGKTANTNVRVGKYASTVSLTSDKTTAYIPTTFTISGVVSNENGVVANASVKIMNNNTVFDTLTTNSNGIFSKTITADSVTSYSLQAVYEETSTDYASSSSMITVTAKKLDTSLTMDLSSTSMYYTQSVTVSGVLTDELGAVISGATIRLMQNGSQVATTTTNSSGAYSFSRQYNSLGTFALNTQYNEDSTHNSSVSSSKSVTVSKAPTAVSFTGTFEPGNTIQIGVSSSYGTFSADSVRVSFNGSTTTLTTKNSSGKFEYTLPLGVEGTLTATYNGATYYNGSSRSATVNLTIGTLTISQSGDYLIVNVKDSNNNIVPNYSITSSNPLVFHLTGFALSTITTDNEVTDSNGNCTSISLAALSGSGTVYATLEGVTSNTINVSF